jgi:integrase
MSVYKRFKGKRVKPGSKDYNKGTWYVWKRIKGRPTPIHEPIPEATTKLEAEDAAAEIIRLAKSGKSTKPIECPAFWVFVDTTYRRYATQKNVNLKAKLSDIDVLIKLFGKKKALTEITAQDCRDVQFALQNTPTITGGKRSPSTVNRTMSTASKIFTLACEEGLLERNPMQFVRHLEEPPPRQRLLTGEQKEKFWTEALKDRFMFRIVMLAVNLPLRRGQILAIKKENVDLENRTLFIIRSKNRPPRAVPLNNAALQILIEMCEETTSGTLILHRGKPIHDFRTRWKKLLVRAEINVEGGTREDNFHFHDLRTEFGTNLAKNGVHPEVIRQLYAHSSPVITQTYMQVSDMLHEAVGTLDGNIQQAEGIQ